MSQLAEFFVMSRADFATLAESAQPKRKLLGRARTGFVDTLAARGKELPGIEWSGLYVGVLIAYLDERGIELPDAELDEAASRLSDARQAATFAFATESKRHFPELDPERFDPAEMRSYFEELNEREDAQAGEAMRDVLTTLRGHLAALDDQSVLVVSIA